MKNNEVLAEEVNHFQKLLFYFCEYIILVLINRIESIYRAQISKHDEAALKFLKDIKWSKVDNPKGFQLAFHFDTNLYFKNSILTKMYHMIDEDELILEKAIGAQISKHDEAALKFFKDIKWSKVDNPKGFQLAFHFDTNLYFKNSILTKMYHMIDEDEPILEKAIGTEIEWYPGKCLTHKILKKKPTKGTKNAKPITKTEQCESFINFFSPPEVPEEDEDAASFFFCLCLREMSNKDSFNMADLGSVLNVEDRADLVNALKNKLQDLTGKHSAVLENLPPNVRKRVDVLREIQSEHDELETKFFEERATLEAKYQKLYSPLYAKRYKIVNGIVEVEGATTGGEPTNQEEGKDAGEKGVPDFWLTSMKNNEVLSEEISEHDEAALKFLKDIKWSRVDNPKGFQLTFHFDTNPYFKNSVLTKTYHMIDEDEPILEKAIGTEIEWYPGKCLTQKSLKKKPKKGSKNAKPITKTEQCESFFNFFSPPEVPEDEDIDEDAAEEFQNLMEQDYDVGSTIRDKVIPHAVSWFTGEAALDEYGDIEDDDEDEDIDEDDDEEDEDDDEEDEDEEETKNRKKKSGNAHTGNDQQGERPPECKQQ
ncbi:unnamed protein product [Fraxinus pennsylvanica]|uniref:Uncharacterized protein n=1 Tax=Fraxinus pennsylvanica TaxID=56036 RepID=A0AAD1ZA74_9LAMI|nr:unnamed protein product [Fraxinus pennsylvanica]